MGREFASQFNIQCLLVLWIGVWIWTFRVNRGSGSTATRDYLTLGQHDKSPTNQLSPIRFDIFEIFEICDDSDVHPSGPNSDFQLPTPLKATRPNLKVHDDDPVGETARKGSSLRVQPPTLACLRSCAGSRLDPNPPRQRDYGRLCVSKDWRREVTLGECQQS